MNDPHEELKQYVGLPKCQDCGWKWGNDITNHCPCNTANRDDERHEKAHNRARELQKLVMNIPEAPPQTDAVRYFNPFDREITCDDNDILLAKWAAEAFIKTKKRVDDAEESAEKTWKLWAQVGTELRAAKLAGKDIDSLLKSEAELRESKSSWEALRAEALTELEKDQKALEPFWRDGTLAKAGFPDLDLEILDFGGAEPPSPLVSRVTYDHDVMKARAQRDGAQLVAENLRDLLWEQVRKEGDPDKSPRNLPWEKQS